MKTNILLLFLLLLFLIGCTQTSPQYAPEDRPDAAYEQQKPTEYDDALPESVSDLRSEQKSEFKKYSPTDFAIPPEIQCWYNKTHGEINYKITNTLQKPLHIARTTYNQPERAHISMILNGRLVEPEEYCDKITIEPNEQGLCSINFDPTQQKTGIFRIYHTYDYLQEYGGAKPRDVLRIRLLNDGEKTRANIKFDCKAI